MADARPLGRWKVSSQQARAFLFHARPDGKDAEVLVAWTSEPTGELQLPVVPTPAPFDQFGPNRAATR